MTKQTSKRFNPAACALAVVLALFGVGGAVQAATCRLPSERPFRKHSEPVKKFDTAKFVNSVAKDLGDDYMGYAVVLRGKAGRVIGKATYGWARTRCDGGGEQAFNAQTQTAWGSVTKVVTGVAVIDKTERSNVRNLDELMLDHLPRRWQDDVHRGYREVTIRQLLQHRAGFQHSAPTVDGRELSLHERLARRPELTVGQRSYANASFAVFQYMGSFFQLGHWEEIEDGYQPGEITYDDYIHVFGASVYKDTIKRRILEPLGIKASCNDIDYAGSNYAHYYTSPAAKTGKHLTPQEFPGCSVGGLVMSALDMGTFLHALVHSNDLISRESYALMARPGADRLVWATTGQTTDGRFYSHNGARFGKLKAQIIAFPNGLTAVAVVNSTAPEGARSLGDVLKRAYEKGL